MMKHPVVSFPSLCASRRLGETGDARIKKSGSSEPLTKRQGGREVSGKAMQDEFMANAKTLVVEKSKSLEEG
jgi:hypothetical protein